jgi:hypothetical protein
VEHWCDRPWHVVRVTYGERVRSEQVVFVGGPLDGMTKDVPRGLGAFEVPVEFPEGTVVHHRYGQADLVDPDDAPLSPDGERRYVYLGTAKTF